MVGIVHASHAGATIAEVLPKLTPLVEQRIQHLRWQISEYEKELANAQAAGVAGKCAGCGADEIVSDLGGIRVSNLGPHSRLCPKCLGGASSQPG